jgi:eukaryotic translation initiation factor 2C
MEGEAVAKNERKVGGGGGGGVSNDGGANARRRWKGGGGRHHPIIQAYPALLPLPLHAAHARRNGTVALPLPLPPPVLVCLHQPPPPLLFPKVPACYGKPNGPPLLRGPPWRSRKPPPPPHAVTAALLPLPHGKALSFPPLITSLPLLATPVS